MNEWTVVTVIVAIVGLFFTVGKPITNLKGNIVKLNCTVEALSAKQHAQEKSMHKQAALNRESHMRRWDHNDEQDKKLSNHEQRLDRLEEKQMNEEQSRHHNVAPALPSLSKKSSTSLTKGLQPAAAHSLCASGAQLAPLQAVKYFSRRTCRRKKQIKFYLRLRTQNLRGFFDRLNNISRMKRDILFWCGTSLCLCFALCGLKLFDGFFTGASRGSEPWGVRLKLSSQLRRRALP